MSAKKKPKAKKAPRKKTAAGKKTATKKVTLKSATPARPRASAGSSGSDSDQIRVRMYRVGFGDFFLLTVPGADAKPLHILIDCGVHAANLNSIGAAIDQLQTETSGQLALIIMTHRHADHISGFATGKATFAKFTVERIWMSWFEDPSNEQAKAFQATLAAVALKVQRTMALRGIGPEDPAAGEFLLMAQNITGDMSVTGDMSAAGSSNAVALQTLHGGFANKPPIDYYQAGDTAILPASLVKAGLAAQILGPPIDPNLVKQMNGKGEQYLTASSDDDTPPRRFSAAFHASASDYPKAAWDLFSPAEIASNIEQQSPDLLTATATQADNTLNNQSLVVHFTFDGKSMLFAGDAQWGNWQNFLFGGKPGTAGGKLAPEAEAILGGIDFYKVGHHGSTNATPIDALKAMKQDMVAMCSTAEGAYGKVANKSEVPRIPLIAALETKTDDQLARSDQVAVTGTQARKPDPDGAIPPLPPDFVTGPNGSTYVDLKM
jgi:beta-lactamase superfamily II metal-dependent hydrolase